MLPLVIWEMLLSKGKYFGLGCMLCISGQAECRCGMFCSGMPTSKTVARGEPNAGDRASWGLITAFSALDLIVKIIS